MNGTFKVEGEKLMGVLGKYVRNKDDIKHYRNVKKLYEYEKSEGNYDKLSDDLKNIIFNYYTNLSDEELNIKLRKIKLNNINSKNN